MMTIATPTTTTCVICLQSVPADRKYLHFCTPRGERGKVLSREWVGFFEGNPINYGPDQLEVERELDHYVTDLLSDTAVVSADMLADKAERESTEAPLLIESAQPTCEAPGCKHPSTHVITTTDPWTYTCCFHYSEEFTGRVCGCRPPAAPSASAHIDTPVSTLPSLSAAPVAAGDILAMYREAYGWSKAELDDLVTLEQLSVDHAQIEVVL